MRLESFRITNFRSINDSGNIDVSQLTALLGRNESGKSNLLRALHSLNPAEGFEALDPVKDFPKHRRLSECTPDTPVVCSLWKLDEDEKNDLVKLLPRAATVTHVEINRNYQGKYRYITFPNLAVQDFDETAVRTRVRKLVSAVQAVADSLEENKKAALYSAAEAFERALAIVPDTTEWAESAVTGLQDLRKALATADVDLTEKQDKLVDELEELASSIAGDKEAQQKARTWILKQMPHFVLLDEYPELKGHQNIAQYLSRRNGQPQGDKDTAVSDRNFEKLCKVADLDPDELHQLLTDDQAEKRNQLANRAGAVVTSEIKRLWKDRPLKVRFNLDANHLDTFISDPNSTYDIEVNLSERSRGFQWFFSFYITFSADTNGGEAEDAILLLDEPGLYLHAKSQSDLLSHLEHDFTNQIIYTTHSPFMVPTHALDSVRTVNIAEETGTTVTNDPTGDARTLFPLQAALGYNLAQSLFVGPNNLIVEGVTDFWILSTVSDYLADSGRTALLPDLTLTPAGGAQKVSYMVALLTSEELNVLVLLDAEKDARSTKNSLVRSKLISEQNVIFVSEAFEDQIPNEADIEDLLEPDVYENLVREAYKQELKGKTLKLNTNIPRIAWRMELALKELDVAFHKTRPARLFLEKMAKDPSSVVPESTSARFEALFEKINERLDTHIRRRTKPFQ